MNNDNSDGTREQSMKDWENKKEAIIAKPPSERWKNYAFYAGLAVVFAGMWFFKQSGGNEASKAKSAEAVLAEKKPVQKLKEITPANVPTVKENLVNRAPEPAYDAAKAQREQEEHALQEKERMMQEARKKSAIMPDGNSSASGQGQLAASSDASTALGVKKGGEGAQDANSRFERAVTGNTVPVSKSEQIDNLQYKILQGKMIEAVLEPRAISDLPGMVCATVQRDVFGAKGKTALIPWGSRLCGVYSADIRKGQERLFIVWNNVYRPDGVTIVIDSPGADQLGSSGMGGEIDNHYLEIFGASAAIAIVGAGASNVGVNTGDQYNSSAAYRQSVAQSAAQTSQSVLQQYGSIPPTITVPAGSIVRVYVNRTLDFTDAYKDEIEAAKQNGVVLIQ